MTCFHASTLREHLHLSVDVLCDMITQALCRPEDVEKERDVILQEMDMSAEMLEDHIFDLYFQEAYPENSLGRPILGTPESLQNIKAEDLKNFYNENYRGSHLIFSIAGDVRHSDVVHQIKKYFEDHKGVMDPIISSDPLTGPSVSSSSAMGPFELPSPSSEAKKNRKNRSVLSQRETPRLSGFRKIVQKSSEQAHILLGFSSTAYVDDFRFEAYILNAVLGSGMTSRLYQKVREDKALVYSIYSLLQSFTDTGLLLIYAATSPENVKEVLGYIKEEVDRIIQEGISNDDLEIFKTQVIGSIVMGSDDVENRMNSIAVNEMIFKKYKSVDAIVEEVQRVTKETLLQYIQTYFDWKNSGAIIIGDVNDKSILDALPAWD